MNRILTNIISKFWGGNSRSKKAKKNIIISFFIKGISIFTSFLLVPITLGYLKPVEYGVWMTLSSILVWLNYFDIGLGNGLRNKLAEALANNQIELGRIYLSTTIFLLSIIIIPIIVAILILNRSLDWYSILNISPGLIPNLNNIISILLILCGVQFVVKIIGTVYVAHQIPIVNDIIGCSGQIISLIYIFILTKTTNGDFDKVVIGFSLAPIIVYLLTYPYTFYIKYRHLRPSYKFIRKQYISQLGGLSYQFFIIQIVCLILFSSSNIIITHLFGPSTVSVYNIGYKYISVTLMAYSIILAPYWTAITDAFTKKDYAWIINSYKLLNKIWYCFIGIIIFLILVSDFIFQMWIKNELIIPKGLLICIGFYIIILMKSNLYATFFNGVGILKFQICIAIIESLSYVILLYLSIPYFGFIAIPLSLGLSMAFGTIGYYFYFKKLIKGF